MRTRDPRSTAVARWAGAVLALLLTGASLAGCGDDSATATDGAEESGQPSASAAEGTPSAEAPGPQCSEVWVAGETLPGTYGSCYDGDTEVEPGSRPCSFGKPLLTHDDRFWSVRGGRIAETTESELLEDKGYRAVLRSCTA